MWQAGRRAIAGGTTRVAACRCTMAACCFATARSRRREAPRLGAQGMLHPEPPSKEGIMHQLHACGHEWARPEGSSLLKHASLQACASAGQRGQGWGSAPDPRQAEAAGGPALPSCSEICIGCLGLGLWGCRPDPPPCCAPPWGTDCGSWPPRRAAEPFREPPASPYMPQTCSLIDGTTLVCACLPVDCTYRSPPGMHACQPSSLPAFCTCMPALLHYTHAPHAPARRPSALHPCAHPLRPPCAARLFRVVHPHPGDPLPLGGL